MSSATGNRHSVTAVRQGVFSMLRAPQTIAALAVAMLAAFMIAVALSSAFVAGGLERSGARVEHAHQVRDGLRRIIARVVEAESGHRGYLLTGEQFYLEPMRDAEAALPRETDAVVRLVADNQEQSARLDMLMRRVEDKMQTMAAIQTIARDQSFDAARRAFDADIGLVQMRELAATVDVIIAEEENLLAARQRAEDRQRLQLSILLGALLLSTFVLAGLAYLTARRQLRDVERERGRTAALNAELEERVRARTADLETARARAESEAERAERERGRVEMLLRDLNHRVGNNLSMVSAVLGLQASKTEDPQARAALSAARERVFLIGSAQRRLRLGEDLQSVRAGDLFERIVCDIVDALPGDVAIDVRHHYEDALLDSRDGVTLAVVLGELVTNSLKHAFAGRSEGTIWTSFRRNLDGVFVLDVSDDGAGLGEGSAQSGIGSLVINEMSRQFGGQITRGERPGGGASISMTLPGLEIAAAA